MKVLVTGGVRSGKSRHAEGLLAEQVDVTYVAPGPQYDDADWEQRIARHRARRPSTWVTRETTDVAQAIREARGPVLVDCLGTWLTALLDDAGLWDASESDVSDHVHRHLEELQAAIQDHANHASIVLVTNEVGLGVVPAHRSGRLFRDMLGTINQGVAEACDDVHLVIAGRVLEL